MSETAPQPSGELCATCPKRSALARALIQMSGTKIESGECRGPVRVQHGALDIETRTLEEPAPSHKDFNYSSTSQDPETGAIHYYRTRWQASEIVCDADLAPRDGEIPYSEYTPLIVGSGNQRRAAFVSGNEQALAHHRAIQRNTITPNNMTE